MNTKSVEQLVSAQDFRDYFAAIPDEKWITGDYESEQGCCALGWLGWGPQCYHKRQRCYGAAEKLNRMIYGHFNCNIAALNDGNQFCPEQFRTLQPKARIIGALDAIISKERKD